MIEIFKNTAKQTFVYSLGNLSVKIAGLILLPLYTTKLTTADYGNYAIFETTATYLSIIFSMNINQSLMRWYLDTNDNNERKKIVFSSLIFTIISLFIFNLTFNFFTDSFSIILFKTDSFSSLFYIFFAYVTFDVFNNLTLSLLRVMEKSKLFITVSLLKLLIFFSFNIFFLTKYAMGIKGILISSLISSVFSFLVLIPILIKNIKFEVDFKLFKPMLKYAIPLAFTSISTVLLDTSDRYLLQTMTKSEFLGVYAFAYKITGMLNFFILNSFSLAFLPIAYKIYKLPNAKEIFSKVFKYLVIFMLFVGLGLSLFSKEFLFIFSPKNRDFWEAWKYVPFLSLIVIFSAMRFMYSINFLIVKKNIYQPIFVIGTLFVNIALNLFLIPKYFIFGAVISSTISSFILNVLYYMYSHKLYPINYQIIKIWLMIVATVGFCLLGIVFNFGIMFSLSIKVVILLIFPIFVYFSGTFDKKEKEAINLILKNIRNKQFMKEYISKILSK